MLVSFSYLAAIFFSVEQMIHVSHLQVILFRFTALAHNYTLVKHVTRVHKTEQSKKWNELDALLLQSGILLCGVDYWQLKLTDMPSGGIKSLLT